MRMRKNTVPLHFSLLSPVVPAPAFSDPHLPLQVQLSQPSDFSSQPSQLQDLHRLIRHDLRPTTPTPLRSAAVRFAFKDGKTNEEQRDHEISNNSGKQSDSGAVAADDNGVVKLQIPLSLSNQITTDDVGVTTPGRWCEGEKVMPLKKRKASLKMNGVVTGPPGGEYNCKMKSMTNKNCPSKKEEDDDGDYEEGDNSSDDSDAKKKKKNGRKKKKKGGGRVMEGSRCSRVNGRGWRCMQPTLVGYSLCEHHLGKGRLRSINNSTVRSRPIVKGPAARTKFIHDYDEDDGDVDEEDDRKQVSAVAGGGIGRKRMRIGMVKARSLSSLLCQPNTAFGASSA